MPVETRDERREARAEWRRRWRAVPAADQRAVGEALRRGTAVENSALAAVAAEAAERRLRGEDGNAVARYRVPIVAAQALLAAAVLAAGVAGGDALRVLYGAVLAVLAIGECFRYRVERDRLRRALAANRAPSGEPRYSAGTM